MTIFGFNVKQSIAHNLDKAVLYTMNRRVPDSLAHSYEDAPSLEEVLANTTVNLTKTISYNLSAPGEHQVWLNTLNGELMCRVKVRPAKNPQAPLLIYHHGLSEIPYHNSWGRIFPKSIDLAVHCVCIQAPYHSNWQDPFSKGLASIQQIYQVFAGSLRLIELTQKHFEYEGAAYSVLSGVSWGGITSLLYESLLGRTRAVIPMLAGPNLAQVFLDIAHLFNRPISISRQQLEQLLDFTSYYHSCDGDRVFPLLGQHDLFFKYEYHAGVFAERPVVVIPGGHITGYLRVTSFREHIFRVLDWAEQNPIK